METILEKKKERTPPNKLVIASTETVFLKLENVTLFGQRHLNEEETHNFMAKTLKNICQNPHVSPSVFGSFLCASVLFFNKL